MTEREELQTNSRRILHVEDHMGIASAFQTAAELAGNESTIVSSPEEARQSVRGAKFDLIVTDGLEGRWQEVCEIGAEEGVRTVVLSATKHVVDSARRKGIEALIKSTKDEDYRKARNLFTER